LSEVVGQLKDLSLRLRMGVTIDGLLNSVESEKRQMCFASHFFDFVAHVVQALGLLGALFQWRSGFNWRAFIGFEDPDGNQLYLAELNWSHVEKGEGEYQPAKA